MKNHFITSYFGNKREEVEKIYEVIKDAKNIKYIIECYCGSCAISYYISTIHPKKYKYILNDNNKFLVELLEIMKDENKYNLWIEEINKIFELIVDKESYLKYTNKNTLNGWFIGNKYYNIRPFLYPTNKKITKLTDDYPIINFLRNEDITILNKDGLEVFNTYCNDKNSLLFIDPPYLLANNSFYKTPGIEIYEYLTNIKKYKSKIICALGDNFIIRLIFKNNKIIEYDKKYQTTKKTLKHLIITNF